MAIFELPKTKSPLWFRVISKLLYKIGIVTIYTKGTPDTKWSIMFYKHYKEAK